jgi:hypothetical protein
MIFGKKKKQDNYVPKIKIEDQILEIVDQTKFLGVIVDHELNWKKHIIYTSKKIAKAIGILTKTKQILNTKILIQLYYSFLYPYLIYGNLIWGNATASALWPIYKLQKIALRLITNTPRGMSTLKLSKTLRILRLPEIYTYSATLFMFKYNHNMLPSSFDHLFHRNNTYHQHNTRGSSNLRPPKINTTMAEKFITCTGAKLWNDIGSKIDSTLKIGTFKQKLITLLIMDYDN